MRLHLEQRTREHEAAGMSPIDARHAALRQFGGVEQIKEQCRDRHPWVRVELLLKEFRFAARSLRRAPGFSLAVLTTLPRLPFSAAGTLASSLDSMLGNRRALMVLLAMVAALALCLAAVGLYGVLNYDVSQRTKEIGIRGAIGATLAMILREGLLKASLGLVVGGIGAFLFTRFLSKMLFDVGPRDPVAFGGVAGLLLAVAVVASWIPARRAAKIDPMMALRCE